MPRHNYDARRGRRRPVATPSWEWLAEELHAARNRSKPVAPAVHKRRYQDNRTDRGVAVTTPQHRKVA